MRLLGYPAHRISILTTYNGQKALIGDVIERRCAGHPAFGRPARVATVDKYQGQQNDYVLLSLVRTAHFGHLRDVRRLVVAMSRSRLGLYVFGRAELFGNSYELQPTFRWGERLGVAGVGRGWEGARVGCGWRGLAAWRAAGGLHGLGGWGLGASFGGTCVADGWVDLIGPGDGCRAVCNWMLTAAWPPPLRPRVRSQLLARPTKLEVAPAERYGARDRPVDQAPAGALVVGGVDHMASLVAGMTREWEAAATAAARPAEQPVVEEAAPAAAGEPSAEGEPAAAAGDAEMQQA